MSLKKQQGLVKENASFFHRDMNETKSNPVITIGSWPHQKIRHGFEYNRNQNPFGLSHIRKIYKLETADHNKASVIQRINRIQHETGKKELLTLDICKPYIYF